MTDDVSVLRLSKYVANTAHMSRKEATEAIKKGLIQVNNVVNILPYYEVQSNDIITYKSKVLIPVKHHIYLLMNKPKGVGNDENKIAKKPSIQQLAKKHTNVVITQLIPLEATSSGLTILTDDDTLIKKYTTENKKNKSVYEIILSSSVDYPSIEALFDKSINTDLVIISQENRNDNQLKITVETQTMSDIDLANIFIRAEIPIVSLDRVILNGLTKKDLKRGWSRPLLEKELIFLKYF